MFSFALELEGCKDSKELWRLIEPLGVNLMDLDQYVYVYGKGEIDILTQTFYICSKHGTLRGEFQPEGGWRKWS